MLYGMKQVKQLGRIFCLLFTAAFCSLFLWAAAEPKTPAFTIIVGKDASADGSVLVAHNQGRTGKNVFVNVHKVPAQTHGPFKKLLLKNHGFIPQPRKTLGFLWFEIPLADFCDSCMNEKGVVITSNTCRSREDKPELTDGGIGFMLRRIAAEQAVSARDAVEIAGRLIQQFGYYGPGQCYVFADPGEAWILQAASGKHWVARRVPDDQVAVVSNRFTIDKVNLMEEKNYMGSPDIVGYAVKRGWYNPRKDGEFSFAKVYAHPADYHAKDNVLCQWRGTSLLAKKKFKPEALLPFSFKPRKNIRVADLFQVLRDQYEGTEYESAAAPESKEVIQHRPICCKFIQYAFVAQLRKNLPPEIANLVWVTFHRPDTNAFSPWYFSITAPPEGWTYGSAEEALKFHFTPLKALPAVDLQYAFWNFVKLTRQVDRYYRVYIKGVRKEWRNFENYALKTQRNTEKEFDYLVQKNRDVALKLITNYVHRLEYRKWFLVSELIGQTR